MWFGCQQPFLLGGTLRDIQKTAARETTEQMDAILNQILDKINCILFYGQSNAGKSLVMRSGFCVYPECAQLYQGVANNFMFEPLEEAEVCL